VQDDLRLPALHEVSDEAAVDAEEHQAAAGPQHPLDLGERRRDVVHVGVHVGEHDHAGRGAPHRAPGHVRAHQVLQAPPSGTWSCPADSSRSITPAAGPLDHGRRRRPGPGTSPGRGRATRVSQEGLPSGPEPAQRLETSSYHSAIAS
jgi:hypothetical protein